MDATDAREQLRVALAPWHTPLCAVATLPPKSDVEPPRVDALEQTPNDDEIFWLDCHGVTTTQHLEALELFALLAHVDYTLWKDLTRELFPHESTDWLDCFAVRTSLRVGLDVTVYDDDCDVGTFAAFLVDFFTATRSARFTHTRECMENVLVVTASPASWPVVPVSFGCDMLDDGRGEAPDHLVVYMVPEGGGDHVAAQDEEGDAPDTDDDNGDNDDNDDDVNGPNERTSDRGHESDTSDVDGFDDGHGPVATLLADLYDSFERQPPHDSGVLRVTHFALGRFITINEAVLARLVDIRNLGIHVTSLPTVCLDLEGVARTNALQSMRTLLDVATTTAPRGAASPTTRGVEHFSIRNLGARLASDPVHAAHLVGSIHSAVRASTSLRRVFIDFKPVVSRSMDSPDSRDDDDGVDTARRSRVWWTMFGLFFRRSLETVDITANRLDRQDVQWLEQMWTASNPLALLFPDDVDDALDPHVAVASRIYLQEPKGSEPVAESMTWVAPTPCALEAIGTCQNGVYSVLLPGWGQAWVKQENGTTMSKATHPTSTARSPTNMIVRRATSQDTVLALLRVVGRELKHLAIRDSNFDDGTVEDTFFADVLTACPHLQHLELSGVTSLDAVVDTFQKQQCAQLEWLQLKACRLRVDSEPWRLFEALANPHSVIAKQLKKLQCDLFGVVQRRTVDTLLRMLRANDRLREVHVFCESERDLADEYEPLFAPFELSHATEPLPARCICAFLSTARTGVARRSDADDSVQCTQLEQLDSRVLSLIIAFAADARLRSVSVRFDRPRPRQPLPWPE